jgi:beta-lactamase class A
MFGALLLVAAFTMPPQKSDAVIGVAAIHVETGKRISVRGTQRFPMGSVYKFPIALAVLRRVDTGTLSLGQLVTIEPKDFGPGWSPLRDGANGETLTLSVAELLSHMVSVSDNTASDALLRLIGGPQSVSLRLAELGLGGIRVDRSEKQMAADLAKPGGVERYARDVRDTASPEAMAELLVAFWKGRDGLTPGSHALLLGFMTASETGPRRLKAGVPADAVVAHKTGTMPGTTNDAGIITSPDGENHIAIVVFTKASKRDKTRDAEDDIAAITRAVYAELLGER